ncbi:MAG TPA: hypothetical protein VMC85_06895 [Desulfomonilaceae bacterium]|nr:hypothetical protein [Desulfomonilaceae bacterium]
MDCVEREVTVSDWDRVDIVILTVMIVHRNSLLALIRKPKRRDKLGVAGGLYPMPLPDQVLEAGCDFVAKGEREGTISNRNAQLTHRTAGP